MTNKKIPSLSAGENERGVLSVFAEIRKAKMLRGLTFLAVAYAYNNKNNEKRNYNWSRWICRILYSRTFHQRRL